MSPAKCASQNRLRHVLLYVCGYHCELTAITTPMPLPLPCSQCAQSVDNNLYGCQSIECHPIYEFIHVDVQHIYTLFIQCSPHT